jgi:hypothetical protein
MPSRHTSRAWQRTWPPRTVRMMQTAAAHEPATLRAVCLTPLAKSSYATSRRLCESASARSFFKLWFSI